MTSRRHPAALSSTATGITGHGHMPHRPPVQPSLHPSHHSARFITRADTPTRRHHPHSRSPSRPPAVPSLALSHSGPTPKMFHLKHITRPLTPSHHLGPSPDRPIPLFFPPRKWAEKGSLPRPPKMGQNLPQKGTAKNCDTPQPLSSLKSLAIHPSTGARFCRLHKFVTPLRYKIPPFPLGQPRAKICDTPQIQNTPQIPGTALAANESLFPRPKWPQNRGKSALRPKNPQKVTCTARKNL